MCKYGSALAPLTVWLALAAGCAIDAEDLSQPTLDSGPGVADPEARDPGDVADKHHGTCTPYVMCGGACPPQDTLLQYVCSSSCENAGAPCNPTNAVQCREAPSGAISASPQRVYVPQGGLGSTTIQWSTEGVCDAEVYVQHNTKPEKLVARNTSGTKTPSWIRPGHTYWFRLYRGLSRDELLDQVRVRGIETVCGNGQCEPGETGSCFQDCGPSEPPCDPNCL